MSAPFPRLAPIHYKNRAALMQRPAWSNLDTDSCGNPCVWLKTYHCVCGAAWSDEWSCLCDDRCPNCDSPNSCDEHPMWIGPIDADEVNLWASLPEAS